MRLAVALLLLLLLILPARADERVDFDALWDFDAPAATEAKFRALLPSATGTYRLELLTQIARTQGLQDRFDDAHRTLDEVLAGCTLDMKRVRVRYLLERGRALRSSGRPAEGRPLFLEALSVASAAGEDALAVDAAHMLGIVDGTLDWNLRALTIAVRSSEPKARRWQASLYNNIGWTYFDAGQHERALAMFQRALERRVAYGDTKRVPEARWAVGRGLRAVGRCQEALAIQEDLAKGPPDGWVFEELAECLLALGRGDEAKAWFGKAYAELSKNSWLVKNEPERLRRLQRLSQ